MEIDTLIPTTSRATGAHEYDVKRGFGAWHAKCRAEMKRTVPDDSDSDFHKKGVEILRVFSAAEALKILNYAKQIEITPANLITVEDYLTHLIIPKKDYVWLLFTKLFTKELDRRLTAYFGSEYLVLWFSLTRTVATPVSEVQFLWHKDMGPTQHAKILVYLNGTDEHGARTDFIDSDATARLGAVGYDFVDISSRLPALDAYAKQAGIAYQPVSPVLKPGECMLFKPFDVLHRGILPTKGPRYMLQVCLLPSTVPWRQRLNSSDTRILQHPRSTVWERSAPWQPSWADTDPTGIIIR